LTRFNLRFHEVLEALNEGGGRNLLRKRIYFGKTVTPVEMDLETLPEGKDPLEGVPYKIVRLTPKMITDETFRFPLKGRELKADRNLEKGLRGYAFVKDDLVVGDIWCACPITKDEKVRHSDMDWLGIEGRAGDVYAFDMYIEPRERGSNLAAPFQSAALYALKAEGFRKVYGYYWTDYLPALWMHRLLKWKERGRVKVWRFFSFRGSSPV